MMSQSGGGSNTPNVSGATGVLPLVNGGTGNAAASANAAFNALSPMTTGGDVLYGGASGVATRLANGTAGQALISSGTTVAPAWGAYVKGARIDASDLTTGNAITQITFTSGSANFDTASGVGTNIYTAKKTGVHLVIMAGFVASVAAYTVGFYYSVNGGAQVQIMSMPNAAGGIQFANAMTTVSLTLNDVLRFYAVSGADPVTGIHLSVVQF